MEPNWGAIGAVGEILGAIAVFASLIYLAVQIRQNTQTTRSAARQAISESVMALPMNFIQTDEFVKAFNAKVHGEQLDRDQALKLEAFSYLTLRSWENIHYQYRSGMLDDEEWRSFRYNLKSLLQMPMHQEYWAREGAIFTDAFRNEIETIYEELSVEPRHLTDSLIFPQGGRSDA